MMTMMVMMHGMNLHYFPFISNRSSRIHGGADIIIPEAAANRNSIIISCAAQITSLRHSLHVMSGTVLTSISHILRISVNLNCTNGHVNSSTENNNNDEHLLIAVYSTLLISS